MNREVTNEFVNTGDGASSSSSSISEVLNTLITEYTCISKPNQSPNADTISDGRYLNSLWVFGNRQTDEPEFPPPTSSANQLMVDLDVIDNQMINKKITSALKILSFREPRVFIQFWSPVVVRKRCMLMTLDQPFGLGMVDKGLYSYRVESEKCMLVINSDNKEKELGPPGRAYKQKKPEWSFDVHGLSTRQYVQDWAASYNINGYINLPVFEPTTGSCVGVLELVTSSKYVDYAFEVREISRALKTENLKCPNVFEDPSFCVGDEKRQHEMDDIFRALKMICDVQKLPLAQTWAPCGNSSFVANSGNLEPSCNSFNRSCIGKACMSTNGLPFYVRDLSMWGFREACRDQHLEKSQGAVVGKSLLSQGSCFCGNVMKLTEVEYPLIHIAAMNGITSCLAIYLKSVGVDREYVIELYMPPDRLTRVCVEDVLETVSHQFDNNATTVQLGTISMSSIQLIGDTTLYWNLESLPESENEPNDIDVTCLKEQTEIAYVEHMEDENVENAPSNSGTSIEKQIEDSETNQARTRRKHREISNEAGRKRKKGEDSISKEEIEKHYGKTMKEAYVSLNVSRSTFKRICRSHGIPRWPHSKGSNDSDPLMKSGQTDVVIHESVEELTAVSKPSGEPSDKRNRTALDLALRQSIAHYALMNKQKTVVVKAGYGDIIVKFPFRLSDGMGKLEELVATRFQLGNGSFFLKYLDDEGDMISVACDSDLEPLGTLKRPIIMIVINNV